MTGSTTPSFLSPLASKIACSSALGVPHILRFSCWIPPLSFLYSMKPQASGSDLFLLYSCSLGARILALTIIFYSKDSPVYISSSDFSHKLLSCSMHACMLSCFVVSNSLDLVNCSLPGYSVHGIFRHEYWSGLSFPPPGDLPNLWIKPCLLNYRQILYH